MTEQPPQVIVLGSLNQDLILNVEHLPRAGETMHSLSFEVQPGGKGANQAAACATLGMPTRIIGAVGADGAGRFMLAALEQCGADTSGVRTIDACATGQAFIHVARNGENTITLHGGANQLLGEPELQSLEGCLARAKVLLLQLEVPLAVNIRAARMARAAGVTVILDPAPAMEALPGELLSNIDVITPNEHEARTLSGENDAVRAAHRLLALGIKTVILKQGGRGALLLTDTNQEEIAAPQVKVVSTVAAGDTFNGALAAALAAGQPLNTAVPFATRVASQRVARPPGYQYLPVQGDL